MKLSWERSSPAAEREYMVIVFIMLLILGSKGGIDFIDNIFHLKFKVKIYFTRIEKLVMTT